MSKNVQPTHWVLIDVGVGLVLLAHRHEHLR